MRVSRTLTAALAATTLAAAAASATSVASAAPAATPDAGAAYDTQMLEVMASTFGTTAAQAAQRLESERTLGASFAATTVVTDGAFFADDGSLVVNVADGSAAAQAAAQGFTPRVAARGEADLVDLAARVPAILGADVAAAQSWSPDLETDSVVVTLDPGTSSSVSDKLTAVDGITVETGAAQGLSPNADVVPGQIMDLDPGTNCSLGFTGTDAGGDNVLLTAGHCVEGLPDILDGSGEHIGVGVATRFSTGSPSVDMGLVDIDAEDTGVGYVDTRTGSTVTITGMSQAPIGSAICKAGNTTGWTCGEIEAYDVTVNYGGGTRASGLAEATVCTEGGDSGGAYISGSLAQGMTSGGPVGVDCGFNGGDVGSYSFYQPVVDAADYYGVQLTTG